MGPDRQRKPVRTIVYGKKGLATLLRTSIKLLWQKEGSEIAPSTPDPTQPQLWRMWRRRRRRMDRNISLKSHIQWISNVDSDLT